MNVISTVLNIKDNSGPEMCLVAVWVVSWVVGWSAGMGWGGGAFGGLLVLACVTIQRHRMDGEYKNCGWC